MQYGLIGKTLKHSFSQAYFTKKFAEWKRDGYTYKNFELPSIEGFKTLIVTNPNLSGLNITIPYKQAVIPFLDKLSREANVIGAVNVIKFDKGELIGHNTDWIGFSESLKPLLRKEDKRALILGTGGASLAIAYALEEMNISYLKVSRSKAENYLSYENASEDLGEFQLVINTTPLGTYPKTEERPPLDLAKVTSQHLFFDLTYNPEKTLFLKEAEQRGARIKNGADMLIIQADKAWEIWNEL